MLLFSKPKLTKDYFLSLILAFLPLSFIAGNLSININIIIFIFFSLLLYSKEIFSIKFYFLDKIILSFFLVIIFTGIYNDVYFLINNLEWKSHYTTIIKSFLFLRFFLLYLILRFLVEKRDLDLSLFFISSFVLSLFVSIDIIYQFLIGEDIFGFKPVGRKLGGPFDDELIAGGYLQRFSILALFFIPIFFSKRIKKYKIPVQCGLFLIFILGIVLSGNRMPLVIFIFVIFTLLILQKEIRKYLIPFCILIPLIFVFFYKFNFEVKNNFTSFQKQVSNMASSIVSKDFDNQTSPQYLKEFVTFYDTWLMNKYIGGGIKNFRYYCHERPKVDKSSKFICNMHPHNYYLEILTETGILGFVILSLILLRVFFLSFIRKYFLESNLKNNIIVVPFIFTFFSELFPIKSTGSFFTTGNATFIFLILPILIGIIRKENSIENKN